MEKLFRGFLDYNFVNWGTNVLGKATSEALFEVYELVKDGIFAQIFGAFGVTLDSLCWEQDQIISFVESHPELLHPKEWATFFLFKVKFDEGKPEEREEFFVAYVHRGDAGQLRAHVRRLSDDRVWPADYRYRFVLPQQAL
ncbi:MAG: hypothetical protein NT041_02530 [Candidatus Vogelbacteria bacterium]|nr:hypothetical protein [Candidatus Vogelbacteria bacterium]